MKHYDVVVLGDYCFDMIFANMPRFPQPGTEVFATELISAGGGAFTVAAAMRRLGIEVGWPAYFGSDEYSAFVYSAAVQEGLDLDLVHVAPFPRRAVTAAIPFQGERAFVSYADPEPPDLFAHWLASVERCTFRHLHLGALPEPEQLAPLVERARSIGATISSDCFDGPPLQRPVVFCAQLGLVDTFMPNMREACILAGTTEPMEAIRYLAERVKTLIVKDGAHGAWIAHDGTVERIPGIDPGTVVDTTGAGDCFTAGLLYGQVVAGYDLRRSVQCGNICGGLSTTRLGGVTGAPNLAGLNHWLSILTASEDH